MSFQGKTAFITGVGRGIGRAIALGLAQKGANLILTDISAETLQETADMAAVYGTRIMSIVLDVSDEDAVRQAIDRAIASFGQVHILINNAGIYPGGDFVQSNSDDWKRTIDINILGTMYPTHAILPHMIEKGYGRIVNIGSVAGYYGISYFVDYSMTKGAVIAFTKALAKAVAQYGITVNCVSPGSINSSGDNLMPEHSFMGRAGTPEECANLVIFMASDEASYISGQNYLIDGCRKKM